MDRRSEWLAMMDVVLFAASLLRGWRWSMRLEGRFPNECNNTHINKRPSSLNPLRLCPRETVKSSSELYHRSAQRLIQALRGATLLKNTKLQKNLSNVLLRFFRNDSKIISLRFEFLPFFSDEHRTCPLLQFWGFFFLLYNEDETEMRFR